VVLTSIIRTCQTEENPQYDFPQQGRDFVGVAV
jgi:hypothetical protein